MEKHSDKKFECKICTQVFFNSNMLKVHQKKIHTKKRKLLKCKLCTASYYFYVSLKRHVEKNHAAVKNETTCTCDICGFQSYSKSYLESHIFRTHSQPFKCLYEGCTKGFCNSILRRQHHFMEHNGNSEVSYV